MKKIFILFAFLFLCGSRAGAQIPAASCSQTDVQNAVNSATTGQTVTVPAGTCSWTGITMSGISLIGAGASTSGTVITAGAANMTKSTSATTRLSGFYFNGTDTHFTVTGATSARAFIVDHNYFYSNGSGTIVGINADGGLIDHNDFHCAATEAPGGDIMAIHPGEAWAQPVTFGILDTQGPNGGERNLYFEDNTFENIYETAPDGDQGVHVVIRYNTYTDSSIVFHGGGNFNDSGNAGGGAQQFEVYNNTFIRSDPNAPMNKWVWARGESGVIANNAMDVVSYGEYPGKLENRLGVGCDDDSPSYPVAQQIGQTTTAAEGVQSPPSYPLLIFGNVAGPHTNGPADSNFIVVDQNGTGSDTTTYDCPSPGTYVQVNRDYYLDNDNRWSGGTSWIPFTYPHPLATGGSALSPSGSPTSGVVPQTVTVINPNTGTTDVCYAASPTTPATDGTGAGCNTGTKYTAPISVSSAETLNLIAGTSTQADSSVVSYTYTASPVVPTVTTTAATSITSTGATSGGTVTATGGASVSSEGVCYGLSANPTTPCTSNGTATPFTSPITGLTPNTTYHYRAFAANSSGTGYGSDSTFTTLSTCANPVTIGPYTACNFAYTDVNTGTTATVSLSPYAGNGIEIIFQYCANSSCNSAPTQTLVSVSDNINSPETCFTQAPHSPYALANTNVPDYETIYALYCPSIPGGVTSFTVTINATANYLQPDVVEWKTGTIAPTGYFENVDNEANAGATAGTATTVPTSATTVHADDLITAMIANCGASIPATVGTGYTGLIVNPTATPGHIFEAMAVSTTGTKTATTTWSAGSASTSCALGAGGSNDTWFGVIVPLVGTGSGSVAGSNMSNGVKISGGAKIQ